MPKPRRTVLSGVVTSLRPDNAVSALSIEPADPAPVHSKSDAAPRPRGATKQATVQQTVYLSPAVHEQLRELAFSERVKMHTLIMEGLDAVFRQRGLKSIDDLTIKP